MSPPLTPVVAKTVITQTAGPIYSGEEKSAWASGVVETAGNVPALASLGQAYQANGTSSTSFDRAFPRVVSCAITASDPANNGLPVYATGVYLLLPNATLPFGLDLRPNFNFPAI